MDQHDKRRERRRAVRIASIIVSATTSPIPCVVLDLSSCGARLHVHDPAEVPDQFRLQLIATDQVFDCRAAWRRGDEIGVQFLP